jgi:transposase
MITRSEGLSPERMTLRPSRRSPSLTRFGVTTQKSRNELKRSRYLWLKNPRNLSQRQRAQLDSLSAANLTTGRAYRMRLAFQELYKSRRFVTSGRFAEPSLW